MNLLVSQVRGLATTLSRIDAASPSAIAAPNSSTTTRAQMLSSVATSSSTSSSEIPSSRTVRLRAAASCGDSPWSRPTAARRTARPTVPTPAPGPPPPPCGPPRSGRDLRSSLPKFDSFVWSMRLFSGFEQGEPFTRPAPPPGGSVPRRGRCRRSGERASVRPLPETTLATDWFWTSGADGHLRMQGCTDCGKFVHPPVPAPRMRQPVVAAHRGVGPVHGGRRHRQPSPMGPGIRAAARHRCGDTRRGPFGAPHHQSVGCDPPEVRVGQELSVGGGGRWRCATVRDGPGRET